MKPKKPKLIAGKLEKFQILMPNFNRVRGYYIQNWGKIISYFMRE